MQHKINIDCLQQLLQRDGKLLGQLLLFDKSDNMAVSEARSLIEYCLHMYSV